VRQTFLLDENILYHAIQGVDRHDQPDQTAAELLKAIATICHAIFIHKYLVERYNSALKRLRERPPRSDVALDFVKQLLHNSAKAIWEYGHLPDLPENLTLPDEDRDIVRAALISKAILVTNDSKLRETVNAHYQILGLKALDAGEALELAKSEPA
jgi:rRNA-processing protein FCF1